MKTPRIDIVIPCYNEQEVLDSDKIKGFVTLSGPSHAEEVIKRKLTVLVSASKKLDDAIGREEKRDGREVRRPDFTSKCSARRNTKRPRTVLGGDFC